ncbi:unnamed protein product [Meganyctiphanes norvegica]|uniref:Cuticle protein 6 n=1 Tax=Meganyctiphanes norvegica TaxID=48144 RepID=A0AAV2PQI5_MEGNR
MNAALKVITLAAVAACGSTQHIGYPGLNYGYQGLHHGYHGLNHGLHHGLQHGVHHGYSGLLHGSSYLGNHHYAAPYAPIQTQYHSQDELGQYSFGYAGGPSNRAETRDAYGNVRGSYNYIDSNGQTQTQHYVADHLGFRVSGTNLPVGPDAPVVLALAGPEPVQDTPEVAAAKVEFQAAYDAAAAAAAAAPDARKKRSADLVAPEPVQDTAEVAQAKAEFMAAYEAAAAAAEAAPDKGPLEDYAPVYNHYGYAGLHHGYAGLHHGYSPLHGLRHTGYSGLHHGLTHHGLRHHGLTHHGLTHHGLTHHALPYAHAHPSRAFSYAHGLTVPSAIHAY